MVRDIVKGESIFAARSTDAGKGDAALLTDLGDTLRANSGVCVGMAANMIGVNKRVIALSAGPFVIVMANPVITKKEGVYEAEEGCLSLDGVRKCRRYRKIEVEYLDSTFRKRKGTFEDFTAEIIQHEVDHLNGIVI